MKNIYLILSILGIIILFAYYFLSKPIEIANLSELKKLENNQKISTTGQVIKQFNFGNYQILVLNNSIQIKSDSKKSFVNKNITLIGKISRFENKIQVIAQEMIDP